MEDPISHGVALVTKNAVSIHKLIFELCILVFYLKSFTDLHRVKINKIKFQCFIRDTYLNTSAM